MNLTEFILFALAHFAGQKGQGQQAAIREVGHLELRAVIGQCCIDLWLANIDVSAD